jgi:hypothetical protein
MTQGQGRGERKLLDWRRQRTGAAFRSVPECSSLGGEERCRSKEGWVKQRKGKARATALHQTNISSDAPSCPLTRAKQETAPWTPIDLPVSCSAGVIFVVLPNPCCWPAKCCRIALEAARSGPGRACTRRLISCSAVSAPHQNSTMRCRPA